MRSRFLPVTMCTLVLVLTASVFCPLAQAQRKARILFINTTGGFHHSSCEHSVPVIHRMARESGIFDVVYSSSADVINRKTLAGFDAIMFANTTGDLKQFPLDEEGRAALMDFIRGGKSFIGVHAATDTYKDWPDYYEMIGGSFIDHPWHDEVVIEVEDPIHPAGQPVPSPWTIKDEIYRFKNYSRDDKHVILRMKSAPIRGEHDATKGDFAIAWAKYHGKGRVFYTSLGHREDVWDDPTYQQHLLGGIRWALGKELGRLKIDPELRIGHGKITSEWDRIFDGKNLKWGEEWESTDGLVGSRLFGQTKDGQAKDYELDGRTHWNVRPTGILQGNGGGFSHVYYTAKEYQNFEYRADININPDGNGGMYFRVLPSNRKPNGRFNNWPNGFEAQINNGNPHDPTRTGSLYHYADAKLQTPDLKRILGYELEKDDGNFWWNMHVVAIGKYVVIKLNGKVAVEQDVTAIDHGKALLGPGYMAFQMHHDNVRLRLRNIEVRELP
jgi:type 1 glutamine amidotransferase